MSGVREYDGISFRGTRVRWYQCPGYEGISIRGTRISVSGVRGYEGIGVRGTRVSVSGVHGYWSESSAFSADSTRIPVYFFLFIRTYHRGNG